MWLVLTALFFVLSPGVLITLGGKRAALVHAVLFGIASYFVTQKIEEFGVGTTVMLSNSLNSQAQNSKPSKKPPMWLVIVLCILVLVVGLMVSLN